MKRLSFLSIFSTLSLIAACGVGPAEELLELGAREQAVTIPARGTASTLDLGTWNIEWFGSTSNGPTNESLQLSNVRDVILGTDLEVWGVQEVVSATSFNSLRSQLPGYAGVLANESTVQSGSSFYSSSEQKVGLLYKTSVATLVGARIILTASDFDFAGRPPLEVRLRVSLNGRTSDLVVIVLHAKAFNDSESWQRRFNASQALKAYLDSTWPTTRVVVLGDFNDDVDTSITSGRASPYKNFVDDPLDYTFPTKALSDAGISTTVRYSDAIDHQLATNELQALYVSGSVQAYRVDQFISNYSSTTSSHLPVLTRYSW
jgi:endonuclease/exonuclease/phosphatase family metal-dependent hydrolase